MPGIAILYEMATAKPFFDMASRNFRTDGVLCKRHHAMPQSTSYCSHNLVGELCNNVLAVTPAPPEIWIVTANPQMTPCPARKIRVVYVPPGWPGIELHRPAQLEGQPRERGTVEIGLEAFKRETVGHTRICQCVNLPRRTAQCACQQQQCSATVLHDCMGTDCLTCTKAGCLWPVLNADNMLIPSIFCLLRRLQTVGDALARLEIPRIPLE